MAIYQCLSQVCSPSRPQVVQLLYIMNLPSALKALDIIVIQGEGSSSPYVDPDRLKKDHYNVFLDLTEDGNALWDRPWEATLMSVRK